MCTMTNSYYKYQTQRDVGEALPEREGRGGRRGGARAVVQDRPRAELRAALRHLDGRPRSAQEVLRKAS